MPSEIKNEKKLPGAKTPAADAAGSATAAAGDASTALDNAVGAGAPTAPAAPPGAVTVAAEAEGEILASLWGVSESVVTAVADRDSAAPGAAPNAVRAVAPPVAFAAELTGRPLRDTPSRAARDGPASAESRVGPAAPPAAGGAEPDPAEPDDPVVSANATGRAETADPIPNATANAPTRPTYRSKPAGAADSAAVTARRRYSMALTRPFEERR